VKEGSVKGGGGGSFDCPSPRERTERKNREKEPRERTKRKNREKEPRERTERKHLDTSKKNPIQSNPIQSKSNSIL
jgi:hypothetical protein